MSGRPASHAPAAVAAGGHDPSADGGVIAVDGGQSGIRLRHIAMSSVVEVDGVSRLEGDTVVQVAEAVARAVREGALPPASLVVLGLTTAPSSAADADHLCALVAAATGAREVLVADDAVTWHAGALPGGYGVSLVAGTGVACLALPAEGQARILGGHGYLLGDEGGGYWLGRHGIGAALRAAEGRGPATRLMDAAHDAFGSLADLHVRLHEQARAVHAIAGFAPVVLDLAREGDPVAARIVDDGAAELAGLAATALTLAAATRTPAVPAERASGPGDVPLALGGRLLEGPGPLRERLVDRLAAAGLAGSVRDAAGSPLDGAMRLADPDVAARYEALVHRWTTPSAASGPRVRAEPVSASSPSAVTMASDRAASGHGLPAGRRYLASARDLLDRLDVAEWPALAAAAALVADALEAGRTVRAFGTGHSHMLAEELYYRAGGLVRVQPILVESLMLHEGGERSTELERIAILGNQVFHDYPMDAGDVLVIASNSGGNAVGTTLAQLASDAGVRVIAIESRAHATSAERRHTGLARLHDVADLVIDNGGRPGDAVVEIAGFAHRVGPTSTVTGAAILNAVVAEAVELLVRRGVTPEVYRSANVEGGDELNARYLPEGSLA